MHGHYRYREYVSDPFQAFGVGAFEDDDDDVYAADDVDRYDFALGDPQAQNTEDKYS